MFFGLVKGYEFSGFRGLAIHGATLGFFFTAYLFNRKYLKRNLFWLLDRVAITVPLGGAAIRVGNFINSEIVGSPTNVPRSEEHTSELQSRGHLVCRLLLEKKKKLIIHYC